jgi:transcriptional regulator NrdR family protein
MNCPTCTKRAAVINTRPSGESMRRRYKCPDGHRWSTLEQIIERVGGSFHTQAQIEAYEAARLEVRDAILEVLGVEILAENTELH